jgi:hypothetical protein
MCIIVLNVYGPPSLDEAVPIVQPRNPCRFGELRERRLQRQAKRFGKQVFCSLFDGPRTRRGELGKIQPSRTTSAPALRAPSRGTTARRIPSCPPASSPPFRRAGFHPILAQTDALPPRATRHHLNRFCPVQPKRMPVVRAQGGCLSQDAAVNRGNGRSTQDSPVASLKPGWKGTLGCRRNNVHPAGQGLGGQAAGDPSCQENRCHPVSRWRPSWLAGGRAGT